MYDEETISSLADLAVTRVLAEHPTKPEHTRSLVPAREPLTVLPSVLSVSPNV